MAACREPPPPPEPREIAEPLEGLTPEEVYDPSGAGSGRTRAPRVVPAFSTDRDYAGDNPIQARRVVYRVTLRVPRNLGSGHSGIPTPPAELYVDVSRDRLRARFIGPGWPVPPGSEVRLRSDEPGGYIFDDEGGHPLGPGQLARWFEGGRLRREASVRIEIPPTREQSGPGALICRLVAEWSEVAPDVLARRCGEGGAPPSFRVGLWRAERTADVGVQLPASALRADHRDPPQAIPPAPSRAFLSLPMMGRLRAIRGARGEPAEDAPSEGLIVENTSPARMIVTIGGTPVAWVESGRSAHLLGIPRGSYPVGAMRPLGLQIAQKRPRVVPGHVRLPR